MKKKRTAALFTSVVILISMTSCNKGESKGASSSNTTLSSTSHSNSDSTSSGSGVAKNKTSELTNYMTEKERSSISEGKLTLIKNESNWGFDADEVTKIKDSVKEISVYDEELDTTFIIHVTLPPDFDKLKTYPMFVMTDGVWRFGDHPALRKMMQDGEAEDVILVSIGYDYSIDGTDNGIRSRYFCEGEEYFLDFITDNLMPYLDEEYKITGKGIATEPSPSPHKCHECESATCSKAIAVISTGALGSCSFA